ncbi:MAG: trehalose-6-phosphate synthase, partial [Bacteroidota bacterium]
KGMLVLSRFTGAARELKEAVLVNPYDTEAIADAIKQALEMPKKEKRRRMTLMQRNIREHNIFWWAHEYIDSLIKLI